MPHRPNVWVEPDERFMNLDLGYDLQVWIEG